MAFFPPRICRGFVFFNFRLSFQLLTKAPKTAGLPLSPRPGHPFLMRQKRM
jgi:hypothetical protein